MGVIPKTVKGQEMIQGSNSKCKEHSKKGCCCGGHNASNAKSNLNHNSTKRRYLIRLTRKLLKKWGLQK